jgi:hypothetical protein
MAAHAPEVLAAAKRALIYGATVNVEETLANERRESAVLRKRRGD